MVNRTLPSHQVRIGAAVPLAELKLWGEWELQGIKHSTWIGSLSFLMDPSKSIYKSEDAAGDIITAPNMIWEGVLAAFNEEGGVAVLADMIDPSVFSGLTGDKVAERDHVGQCHLARLLKRMCGLGAVTGPGAEEIMTKVAAISRDASAWLRARLAKAGDKLTASAPSEESKSLLECITLDLMEPEEAMELATRMFVLPGVHDLGCTLVANMQRGEAEAVLAWLKGVCAYEEPIPVPGEEEQKVERAETKAAEAKGGPDSSDEEEDVDDGSVVVGTEGGLLTAEAEAAASNAMVKQLEAAGLRDAEKMATLLTTLHQVLGKVGSDEGVASVPLLWLSTSLRCLRCCDKYPVREMGLQLFQEAIRMKPYHSSYAAVANKYATPAMHKNILGGALSKHIKTNRVARAFLDSIFSQRYAHHAVIRLASTWLMEVYYRNWIYDNLTVNLVEYLVSAACHPEWGVEEAATDLIVKITVTNISIVSLNSLCGLFKDAVSDKATAAAANTLILAWIDRTRQKKWVLAVQEQVLNLLYTMLVNKSSESEDDTAKVLDYFKNQFKSIRGHASSDVGGYITVGLELSEKEQTARQCILTTASDCLAEIRRSASALRSGSEGGDAAAALSTLSLDDAPPHPPPVPMLRSPSGSAFEDDDLRSRASQAASLLAIVLELVENLRPEVLRALHGPRAPSEMVAELLDEACGAAPFDDVEPSALLARLTLASDLSTYLAPHAPLSPALLERIWALCVEAHPRHRAVTLRWMRTVLRPKEVARDGDYFAPGQGAEARSVILGKLAAMVTGGGGTGALGADGVGCLLALFIWANKDTKCFEEPASVGGNALAQGKNSAALFGDVDDDSDDEAGDWSDEVAVSGQDIAAFDALVVAALDGNPSEGLTAAAARTLLRVSEAVHLATRQQFPHIFRLQAEAGEGLVRYDLLRALLARIGAGTSASDEAKNHWLEVLMGLVSRTAEFNTAPAHGASSQGGESLSLQVSFGPGVGGAQQEQHVFTVDASGHTTLGETLAVVLATVAAADPLSAPAELGAAWCLRPVVPSLVRGAKPLLQEPLKGSKQSLKNLGIQNGAALALCREVVPFSSTSGGEATEAGQGTPADRLAASEADTDLLFGLLEQPATARRAWEILQLLPTTSTAASAAASPRFRRLGVAAGRRPLLAPRVSLPGGHSCIFSAHPC